ncbi:MAG: hypothetical protein V9G20_24595 [Candidatus Promineifilaceae bacterium]
MSNGLNINPPNLYIPSHIQIRDYQEEAIAAWFAHNCQGFV